MNMTRYFYDSEASRILAYEEGSERVRVLSEIVPTASTERKEVDGTPPLEPEPGPRRVREAAPTPRPDKGPKGACSDCGSPSRHKKFCSKAKASSGPTPVSLSDKRPGMSQMVFGRVKISQHNDIPVDVIARNMELDTAEIEKAFEVDTYEEYKRL